MQLAFSKYHGTGNDFILIDNRSGNFQLTNQQIESLCHRRFGIGADGLMLLETADGYDFRMRYYNADGKEGSMCGNGGRCMVQFAHDIGITKGEYRFLAIDGPHDASIEMNSIIRLKMKDVPDFEMHTSFDFVDTGSPHVVKQVAELSTYNVAEEGKTIRNSNKYQDDGVNVNFVQIINNSKIYVRTYERGVEDETYSCGTGVTASALVNAHNERGFNHVEVETNGGMLYVEFDRTGERSFENIWLAGPAVKVFKGSITLL
jgi:diaminopimelate epimerase